MSEVEARKLGYLEHVGYADTPESAWSKACVAERRPFILLRTHRGTADVTYDLATAVNSSWNPEFVGALLNWLDVQTSVMVQTSPSKKANAWSTPSYGDIRHVDPEAARAFVRHLVVIAARPEHYERVEPLDDFYESVSFDWVKTLSHPPRKPFVIQPERKDGR